MSKLEPMAIKQRAAELKDTMASQAERAAQAAGELAKGAAPKVIRVADKTVKAATPVLDNAADQAVKLTEMAGTALDKIHHDMMNDYLPRINQAMEEAVQKSATAIGEEVKAPIEKKLAQVEKKHMKKNKHRCRKAFKWTLLGAGAAAVGYVLWRRSQPIEDPWAEEYWADLETTQDPSEVAAEVPTSEATKDTDKDAGKDTDQK